MGHTEGACWSRDRPQAQRPQARPEVPAPSVPCLLCTGSFSGALRSPRARPPTSAMLGGEEPRWLRTSGKASRRVSFGFAGGTPPAQNRSLGPGGTCIFLAGSGPLPTLNWGALTFTRTILIESGVQGVPYRKTPTSTMENVGGRWWRSTGHRYLPKEGAIPSHGGVSSLGEDGGGVCVPAPAFAHGAQPVGYGGLPTAFPSPSHKSIALLHCCVCSGGARLLRSPSGRAFGSM